jgi:hypothetical protein
MRLQLCKMYVVKTICRRRRGGCSSYLVVTVILIVCGLFGREFLTNVRSTVDVNVLELQDDNNNEVDWLAEFEKARRQSLHEHMAFYVDEKKLRPVPSDWNARDRCPACFGLDVCDAIDEGRLRVDVEEDKTTDAGAKSIYRGWYE